MTIEYTKVGDYYFPNIKINEQLQVPLSKNEIAIFKGTSKGFIQ